MLSFERGYDTISSKKVTAVKIYHIETDGVKMGYFSFGTGERAFVILPGIDTKSVLLSAKAVENAYMVFAQEYTVYVFDRRENMPGDYTVMQMAEDTAAVMRQIGIIGADIFGASQGGMIAMCIAIIHPELVHALMLGSTAARCDEKTGAGIQEWIRLAQARDMTALTADFIENLYSEETIGKYRDLLIHMNDHVSDRDIERFIIGARALRGFDVSGRLDEIACPVLVIGCEGDRVIPPEASRRIAERVNGTLYMYDSRYGHCVFDEAPDYKERLLRFCREHR